MSRRFDYREYPPEIRKRLRKERGYKTKGFEKKRKKSSALKIILLIMLIILLLVGLCVGTLYYVGYKKAHSGELKFDPGDIGIKDGTAPVVHDSGRVIEYKGSTYYYNDDIVTIALLGVDKPDFGLENGDVGSAGQSDTLAVGAFDTKSGVSNIIVIPRDTMADVNIYDVNGAYLDIKKQQICVSYAYGDGKEKSCENTLTSIQRLLLGLPVQYYAAVDLNGIPALNDAVGGIDVTCLETIGQFKQGEKIHLKGKVAESYVRDRDKTVVNADSGRRDRQKQYMELYADKVISNAKKNISSVGTLYNQAQHYAITNMSLDFATYMVSNAIVSDYKLSGFVTVPGKYSMGEQYAEYNVDEEALLEMILNIFYTKK